MENYVLRSSNMYEFILVGLIKLVRNIIAAAWCKQETPCVSFELCFIQVETQAICMNRNLEHVANLPDCKLDEMIIGST